jgi:uncharacterized protein with von Willebrand factor type A (vWA) domain
VLDKQGQPLVNVTADQLRADIDGVPAKIGSISQAAKPAIILLIDVSSSMKSIWNPSIAAARELIRTAGGDIDVVLFRDKIRGLARGRSESEELLSRLSADTLQPGGTALWDTLIEVASRVKTQNAAIVLISDGGDNASTHSSATTVSLLTRSSPPIFALILDYDQAHAREREYFKKIPINTGGLVEYPSSAREVMAAMDELTATVLTPLSVSLQVSAPITKMVKMKLDVVGPSGKPRHDIHILHVAEVTSCDAPH